MSLQEEGIQEKSADDEITRADDTYTATSPAPLNREEELAELANLRQSQPNIDEKLVKSLISVQQNSMLALNTLLFSTLSSIKPIISSDWKHVSEKYNPTKNIEHINVNVNYALQTHLHSATSGELNERIERMSYLFSPIDAKLIITLNQFAETLTLLTSGGGNTQQTKERPSSPPLSPTSSSDVYDSLQSRMSKLQVELNTQDEKSGEIWLKIETFINLINILCNERDNVSERPPSYSDLSPTQSMHRQLSQKSASSTTASIVSSVQDEKMKRDLERVTDSIDRLMRITPQLASQRVELSQKQIIEMDLAKLAGEVESSVKSSKANTSHKTSNGVGKFFPKSINTRRSDNQVISSIEKGNKRRLDSQRVDMGSRLEDARTKMRDADLVDIMQRNRVGRLTEQESDFTETNPRPSSSTKSVQKSPSKDSVDSQTQSMVSQQAYIAEHNVNVGNVLVQFKTQLHGYSKELDIEVDQQARDSVILKNLSNFNVRLKLPTKVVYPQRKRVKLVERDLFEFNLQVSHQSRKSLTTPVVEPPSYPFTSMEFSSSKPSSFRCAKCSRDVASGDQVASYRDLPSEGWSEHVDNWMCHPTQELNADYYRNSISSSANPNEVLIGSNYWVFNKKNIVEKSVRVEYNVSSKALSRATKQNRVVKKAMWGISFITPPVSIQPPNIKSPLLNTRDVSRLLSHHGYIKGEIQLYDEQIQHTLKCICGNAIGGAQSEGLFRFNKVSVWPVSAHKSQPYYNYNIGHHISAELIEQSRNYGSYRYFLQDEQTGELRLLVWLFNPLVKIRTSQVRLNSTIEACKVFWKTNREEPLRDSKMNQIGKLKYPGWILDEFENLLLNGIGSFLGDSPKRFFSDWHIGYIERVSN